MQPSDITKWAQSQVGGGDVVEVGDDGMADSEEVSDVSLGEAANNFRDIAEAVEKAVDGKPEQSSIMEKLVIVRELADELETMDGGVPGGGDDVDTEAAGDNTEVAI